MFKRLERRFNFVHHYLLSSHGDKGKSYNRLLRLIGGCCRWQRSAIAPRWWVECPSFSSCCLSSRRRRTRRWAWLECRMEPRSWSSVLSCCPVGLAGSLLTPQRRRRHWRERRPVVAATWWWPRVASRSDESSDTASPASSGAAAPGGSTPARVLRCHFRAEKIPRTWPLTTFGARGPVVAWTPSCLLVRPFQPVVLVHYFKTLPWKDCSYGSPLKNSFISWGKNPPQNLYTRMKSP